MLGRKADVEVVQHMLSSKADSEEITTFENNIKDLRNKIDHLIIF